MRLATFNLLHGRSLTDGLVDEARLVSAVADLEADVLGLQEVDRAQPRSGELDLTAVVARALGPQAPHRFAAAIAGTPGGTWRAATDADSDGPQYGVGLVSRWPVRSWHVTRLPAAPVRSPVRVPGPDGGWVLLDDEPRVLLAAVVQSPAGVMTVANTHLSFVPGWNVRQLRRAVLALRELPAPRVLLGDLNLPAGAVRVFSGWRLLARCATYPAPAPRVQLDHILVDPREAGRLPPVTRIDTPESAISDHRPLVVELAHRGDDSAAGG